MAYFPVDDTTGIAKNAWLVDVQFVRKAYWRLGNPKKSASIDGYRVWLEAHL